MLILETWGLLMAKEIIISIWTHNDKHGDFIFQHLKYGMN